jgi:RNA polymerase sigma factor (sigma-70 family)
MALETLLRVLRKYDPSKGQSVLNFCYRVLRNISVDSYRADMARPIEVPHEHGPDTPAPGDSPEDAVIEKEHLRECLDSLPANERQAVFLRHFEEFTLREIAVVMGLKDAEDGTPNTSAADRLCKRGRELLRRCLVAHGVQAS